MPIRIIGEDLVAQSDAGQLGSRIATLFLGDRALVTLPGIHATQRLAYIATVNRERLDSGFSPLTDEETEAIWAESVDLILNGSFILIRPGPQGMKQAFAADEMLQEVVSKRCIRYLNVMNPEVSQALRSRGELWRIAPLPHSVSEMQQLISKARIRIGRLPIYYYNMVTGTRFLTCQEFSKLGALDPAALAAQLEEIRDYSGRTNLRGCREVDFFLTEGRFGHANLAGFQFESMGADELRREFDRLRADFELAVKPELRQDDPEEPAWRQLMLQTLIQRHDETVSEEVLRGLSPEFYLQIRWLPGGRVENGELIFDPLFEELEANPGDQELRSLCDQNAKSFFFNSVREYGNIEYANIGRIVTSLSSHPQSSGRRDVYISEVKLQDLELPVVRIIRVLKWGIREHIDEGKTLLQSIIEAEEYVEYTLDRRLGCRQLGMKFPSRISTHKLGERYHGSRHEFEGQILWATYLERDYARGIATDKVALSRFQTREFALRFAKLLGEAAASNLIVGRLHLDGTVLFDSGDEVLILDAEGLPESMVVTDHSGTFSDYQHELVHFASGYADPVNRRVAHVENPAEFARAYLDGFEERFTAIQEEFLRRRRAFLTLFRHCRYDQKGTFAFRWERVLERLEHSDGALLARAVSDRIHLPGKS